MIIGTKLQEWQRDMQEHGWRGCLACLAEALSQGYLCDAEKFSFSEFTFTCPRHNMPTLPAREFIIEFVAGMQPSVALPRDCPDPAQTVLDAFAFLYHYYISGAFYRVQRANIPRKGEWFTR